MIMGVGLDNLDEGNTVFYQRWQKMIERCYSQRIKTLYPTYKDCEVCEEWLLLSNFKEWMLRQDYQGNQLDKDIIIPGNKLYSPDTCAFVCFALNKFVTENQKSESILPIGVQLRGKKYYARITDSGKLKSLGNFETAEEAHAAWKARKHEMAKEWAKIQSDERVSNALMTRYA